MAKEANMATYNDKFHGIRKKIKYQTNLQSLPKSPNFEQSEAQLPLGKCPSGFLPLACGRIRIRNRQQGPPKPKRTVNPLQMPKFPFGQL
jgi:hypothetical protein